MTQGPGPGPSGAGRHRQLLELLERALGCRETSPTRAAREWDCCCDNVRQKWTGLTWNAVHAFAHDDLVAASAGAESLVAHADENHGEEAEEQAGRAPYVPRFEDDTQICGIPSEEHLQDYNILPSAPS